MNEKIKVSAHVKLRIEERTSRGQSKTAMSNPQAACGPVEGFVRPRSSVVKVSHIYVGILTTCILIILNLTFWMQVVLSATLSRLLPLHLGFERIQYISLIRYAKCSLLRSIKGIQCAALINMSFNVWPWSRVT